MAWKTDFKQFRFYKYTRNTLRLSSLYEIFILNLGWKEEEKNKILR